MTTLETIKADRAAAESKLAALRQQRGAALVEGEEGNCLAPYVWASDLRFL